MAGRRYGMDALVITSRATDERWVTQELTDLVDELAPLAEELGCLHELSLIPEILERGAGYQRQRRIHEKTGSWLGVIDATCAEMEEMVPRG